MLTLLSLPDTVTLVRSLLIYCGNNWFAQKFANVVFDFVEFKSDKPKPCLLK